VALRLTEKQRQDAQKRKRKKASQRGKKSKPTAETLYLAGWLIVVTTLPASRWSAQEVLSLYRARWHIEFFFKRFKQLLDVHQVTCVHQERVQASILAHRASLGAPRRGTGSRSSLAPRRSGSARSLVQHGPASRIRARTGWCAQPMDACSLERGSLPQASRRSDFSGSLSPVLAAFATLFTRQSTPAYPLVFPHLELAHLLGSFGFSFDGGEMNGSWVSLKFAPIEFASDILSLELPLHRLILLLI